MGGLASRRRGQEVGLWGPMQFCPSQSLDVWSAGEGQGRVPADPPVLDLGVLDEGGITNHPKLGLRGGVRKSGRCVRMAGAWRPAGLEQEAARPGDRSLRTSRTIAEIAREVTDREAHHDDGGSLYGVRGTASQTASPRPHVADRDLVRPRHLLRRN